MEFNKQHFENSLAFAQQLDDADELKEYKNQFYIPQKNGQPAIYFCGNSLGLQPKNTKQIIENELENWATLGVEGHFSGSDPWATYHVKFKHLLSPLVGALPHEVVAMNSLTTNLHLMLQTFYKPTAKKFKIITEFRNFSSDIYALRSQVALHGLNPDEVIVEIGNKTGTEVIDEQDIIKAIKNHGDSLALVLLSSVNYYTGQSLQLQAIATATHAANAVIGLDLAHAIGNVGMQLHDWGIDFAVWCSYKYLNSGPGAVGGLYVHERHAANTNLLRPAGWWGHRPENRFQMHKEFYPSPDADGFQLSNAPVLSMAAHFAALQLFQAATIAAVINKSQMLTGFLEFLIRTKCTNIDAAFQIEIITPSPIHQRGAQLSIAVKYDGKKLFTILSEAGFVVDLRAEKVIRISPAPLYNGFVEVFRLVDLLKEYARLV